MGRPASPCGTDAAYKRHLRNGEDPCPECRKAHTAKRRTDRRPANLGEALALIHVEARSATSEPDARSAKTDLEWTRDRLIDAIRSTSAEDPTKLGSLTRELRETWKALAALDAGEGDAEDDFTRARAARAARTSGA